MSEITVLAVVSEIYPLIKTGGLADVAGALAGALAAEGVAVVTLVPGYPAVMSKINAAEPVLIEPDLFGGGAQVLRTQRRWARPFRARCSASLRASGWPLYGTGWA